MFASVIGKWKRLEVRIAPLELPAADVAEPEAVAEPENYPRFDERSIHASNVTHTTALLWGTFKRGDGKTRYEFVYVDAPGYDPGRWCPYGHGGSRRMGDAGEARGEQTVALRLTGLLPGTTYHYRLIVTTERWGVAGSDSRRRRYRLPQSRTRARTQTKNSSTKNGLILRLAGKVTSP